MGDSLGYSLVWNYFSRFASPDAGGGAGAVVQVLRRHSLLRPHGVRALCKAVSDASSPTHVAAAVSKLLEIPHCAVGDQACLALVQLLPTPCIERLLAVPPEILGWGPKLLLFHAMLSERSPLVVASQPASTAAEEVLKTTSDEIVAGVWSALPTERSASVSLTLSVFARGAVAALRSVAKDRGLARVAADAASRVLEALEVLAGAASGLPRNCSAKFLSSATTFARTARGSSATVVPCSVVAEACRSASFSSHSVSLRLISWLAARVDGADGSSVQLNGVACECGAECVAHGAGSVDRTTVSSAAVLRGICEVAGIESGQLLEACCDAVGSSLWASPRPDASADLNNPQQVPNADFRGCCLLLGECARQLSITVNNLQADRRALEAALILLLTHFSEHAVRLAMASTGHLSQTEVVKRWWSSYGEEASLALDGLANLDHSASSREDGDAWCLVLRLPLRSLGGKGSSCALLLCHFFTEAVVRCLLTLRPSSEGFNQSYSPPCELRCRQEALLALKAFRRWSVPSVSLNGNAAYIVSEGDLLSEGHALCRAAYCIWLRVVSSAPTAMGSTTVDTRSFPYFSTDDTAALRSLFDIVVVTSMEGESGAQGLARRCERPHPIESFITALALGQNSTLLSSGNKQRAALDLAYFAERHAHWTTATSIVKPITTSASRKRDRDEGNAPYQPRALDRARTHGTFSYGSWVKNVLRTAWHRCGKAHNSEKSNASGELATASSPISGESVLSLLTQAFLSYLPLLPERLAHYIDAAAKEVLAEARRSENDAAAVTAFTSLLEGIAQNLKHRNKMSFDEVARKQRDCGVAICKDRIDGVLIVAAQRVLRLHSEGEFGLEALQQIRSACIETVAGHEHVRCPSDNDESGKAVKTPGSIGTSARGQISWQSILNRLLPTAALHGEDKRALYPSVLFVSNVDDDTENRDRGDCDTHWDKVRAWIVLLNRLVVWRVPGWQAIIAPCLHPVPSDVIDALRPSFLRRVAPTTVSMPPPVAKPLQSRADGTRRDTGLAWAVDSYTNYGRSDVAADNRSVLSPFSPIAEASCVSSTSGVPSALKIEVIIKSHVMRDGGIPDLLSLAKALYKAAKSAARYGGTDGGVAAAMLKNIAQACFEISECPSGDTRAYEYIMIPNVTEMFCMQARAAYDKWIPLDLLVPSLMSDLKSAAVDGNRLKNPTSYAAMLYGGMHVVLDAAKFKKNCSSDTDSSSGANDDIEMEKVWGLMLSDDWCDSVLSQLFYVNTANSMGPLGGDNVEELIANEPFSEAFEFLLLSLPANSFRRVARFQTWLSFWCAALTLTKSSLAERWRAAVVRHGVNIGSYGGDFGELDRAANQKFGDWLRCVIALTPAMCHENVSASKTRFKAGFLLSQPSWLELFVSSALEDVFVPSFGSSTLTLTVALRILPRIVARFRSSKNQDSTFALPPVLRALRSVASRAEPSSWCIGAIEHVLSESTNDAGIAGVCGALVEVVRGVVPPFLLVGGLRNDNGEGKRRLESVLKLCAQHRSDRNKQSIGGVLQIVLEGMATRYAVSRSYYTALLDTIGSDNKGDSSTADELAHFWHDIVCDVPAIADSVRDLWRETPGLCHTIQLIARGVATAAAATVADSGGVKRSSIDLEQLRRRCDFGAVIQASLRHHSSDKDLRTGEGCTAKAATASVATSNVFCSMDQDRMSGREWGYIRSSESSSRATAGMACADQKACSRKIEGSPRAKERFRTPTNAFSLPDANNVARPSINGRGTPGAIRDSRISNSELGNNDSIGEEVGFSLMRQVHDVGTVFASPFGALSNGSEGPNEHQPSKRVRPEVPAQLSASIIPSQRCDRDDNDAFYATIRGRRHNSVVNVLQPRRGPTTK